MKNKHTHEAHCTCQTDAKLYYFNILFDKDTSINIYSTYEHSFGRDGDAEKVHQNKPSIIITKLITIIGHCRSQHKEN